MDAKFIVLEEGKTTVEGQNKACLLSVADDIAAVHVVEPSDIIDMMNGIFSYS